MAEIPSRGDIIRERVRRYGLHEFLRLFWCVADPKCPRFVDNWHFGAMSEVLTAVSKRQIRDVVINQPPGTGKSLAVDVLWPAWHWGPFGDPTHAWMSISFDITLVYRNASQLLDVLGSNQFREAWPEFKFGGKKSAIGEFYNGHGGYRFSTSFEGKGVGRHVHTQVLDDPIKPKDWNNPKILRSTNAIWNGTFATRAIDRSNFARLIIMQRLAEGDTAGEMLREQGYEHLMLPMRYVPNASWDIGCSLGKLDKRTEEGELLFPARFPEVEVAKLEKALALPVIVDAQLQQNPKPLTGGIVEQGWLQKVKDIEQIDLDARIFQSWDFGFKGKKPGDPIGEEMMLSGRSRVSAGLYWESRGETGLIDEIDPRPMSFPESRKAFIEQQTKPLWSRALSILIEDKANGTGIIDDLEEALEDARRQGVELDRNLVRLIQSIIRVDPGSDSKLDRLVRNTDYVRSGRFYVPSVEQCPTIEAWRGEVTGFPKAPYNDRVDVFTQALDHARSAEEAYLTALRNLPKP